jgi:2-polyprenyl-6-methoxyphenol hydroxylase-like FAD-dependent oxidoreductase
VWGDRQTVLEVLRDNLQDKSKLLVNKQVERVDHSTEGVIVRCKDGSSYDGDIVVGADGVFSKVRKEMWRLAEKKLPELVQKERNGEFLMSL